MHTCRCNFPPFIGFCLHSHCWTLNLRGCRAMKEANTLQGESKNHSPLLTTHLRLIKRYYSVSAILVFLYILTIFQCRFWSVDFFFFLPLKFPKSWDFRLYEKCCVDLLSPTVILPASVMMFTDVSLCSSLSLHVVNVPLPSVRILGSSLSPKRALFLPQCDSISLLLSAPFPYITGQLSRCQLCISSTSQTPLAQSEPTLYRGCADTTVLYATKQCNTQAKHSL